MRKFVLLLAVLGLAASGFSQSAARYDLPALTTTPPQVPRGTLPPVLAVINATVSVCGYPAVLSNGMCTNTITTYTDSTLTTACPATAQLTVNGTSVCVSTSGLQGSFGFWYNSATQTHITYTVKAAWGTYGPYDILQGGGGGTGSPGGSPGSLQYNLGGTFAGFSGSCIPKLNGSSAPTCATAGTDYLQSITSSLVLTALGYTPVANTITVNGHALSANVTISATDVGLGNVPNVDATNAANIASGTLNHARLPSLVSADIPNNAANTTGNAATVTTNANLTGDVASAGNATTLANVNAGSGSCGDATHVCQITTNAKGLTTSQSAVAITSGGAGTVTSVSVVTANGFQGTVATATSTPAITVSVDGTHYLPTTTDQTTWNGKATNPMTTLGDFLYGGASGAPTRLAGNTAATDQVPVSHGSGSTATAPTLSNAPALSAANMGSFPTLNQNTTGTAAGLSGSQPANYIYAAPNGLAGTAVFRAMVAADVPTLTPSQAGLGSVTNNAQTQSAIMPNTAPAAGQIPAGNAGGTAYAPVTISGSCTMASTGVITCIAPVSPLTINASAGPVTVSGNTGYWFNNFGAMTYNLPTITSGLVGAQYCFRNYTAITGVLTLQLPASTYVDRNGAIGTVAGHLASAGALGDSACVVAISTTRYVAYIQSGTWVNP